MLSAGDVGFLSSLAGAYAVLAVLPGPNFLVVSQLGLTAPRRHACLAALGIAAGASTLAATALSGTDGLVLPAGTKRALDIGFALLLVCLGLKAMMRAGVVAAQPHLRSGATALGCLWLGFVTALSNPLTLAYFVGFGTAATCHAGSCLPLPAAMTIFAVALLWFGCVALSFSQARLRACYLRIRQPADLVIGLCLWALGIQALLVATSAA